MRPPGYFIAPGPSRCQHAQEMKYNVTETCHMGFLVLFLNKLRLDGVNTNSLRSEAEKNWLKKSMHRCLFNRGKMKDVLVLVIKFHTQMHLFLNCRCFALLLIENTKATKEVASSSMSTVRTKIKK